MNRMIMYGALTVVLLIVFLFVLHIPANENTVRLGHNIESLNYAPFIVAYEKGFFSKHHVIIERIPLKSSKEVKQALSMGQLDIELGSPTNFFIPISKGVPIKIIAPMASAPTYLFVRSDDGQRTLNDLLGKKIATSPGGTSDYFIRYALMKEGIDANKIDFVDIEKAYRPFALMKKKLVDAVLVSEQEEAKYLEIGAVLHEEWRTKGYADQLTPRAVVAVNEEFKRSHPVLVEQFIDAVIEGHEFMRSNPEEATQILALHIKKESEGTIVYLPEEIRTMWEKKKLKYLLWDDPQILFEMSRIAMEIGETVSGLSLDQIFDSDFEEKLRNAQNEIYKETD